MILERKFRDFLIGWLADQLQRPEMTREEVKALYDAVVSVEDDDEVLTEVMETLGDEIAEKLLTLSCHWHDPIVDQARPMIEALRERVEQGARNHTDFYLFFLNPFKTGCVPDGYEEMIEREICWMFEELYSVAAEAVLALNAWEPYVIVEPSYEGASGIVVLASPKTDYLDKVFLLHQWRKAWHLRFANLSELAEELLALRETIQECVTKAMLGYHLTQTATQILGDPLNE